MPSTRGCAVINNKNRIIYRKTIPPFGYELSDAIVANRFQNLLSTSSLNNVNLGRIRRISSKIAFDCVNKTMFQFDNIVIEFIRNQSSSRGETSPRIDKNQA